MLFHRLHPLYMSMTKSTFLWYYTTPSLLQKNCLSILAHLWVSKNRTFFTNLLPVTVHVYTCTVCTVLLCTLSPNCTASFFDVYRVVFAILTGNNFLGKLAFICFYFDVNGVGEVCWIQFFSLDLILTKPSRRGLLNSVLGGGQTNWLIYSPTNPQTRL